MADDPPKKQGVIAAAIERFRKFTSLGKTKKKAEKTVDTSKVSSKPFKLEPNAQQKAAVAAAQKRRTRRVKDGT